MKTLNYHRGAFISTLGGGGIIDANVCNIKALSQGYLHNEGGCKDRNPLPSNIWCDLKTFITGKMEEKSFKGSKHLPII
jgi:hypothetical protein